MTPSPYTGRQRAFLTTHVVLGILATASVVMRFTAKRRQRFRFTVDDYLLLAALVSRKGSAMERPRIDLHIQFFMYIMMASSISCILPPFSSSLLLQQLY
jgi:hypothetical protein